MNPRELLKYCRSELDAMMDCLRRAVEIESPSNSKGDVDRMGRFAAREFKKAGGKVEFLKHTQAGDAILAEFFGSASTRPATVPTAKGVLLLGHLDTVWEVGTLARMPFRLRAGRAYGPGIYDMKSGIVCGLWAIRALWALKIAPLAPVRFFLNPDEEISSLAFRDEITREAHKSCAALVLEPAARGGFLKTARKGVGEFRITAHGRSAHAGIEPAAGVNAISELARQLLRVEKFARPGQGLTLTAGMIQGGTRTNVVPERATAQVDVRIPRLKDRSQIEKKFFSLKPILAGARLEVEGGINRPPMERPMAIGLFRKAQELGREMGFELQEASTGGGSDGNFTAAAGVPTLDGLGGVGNGAHSLDEHIVIQELPARAALLAALIASIS